MIENLHYIKIFLQELLTYMYWQLTFFTGKFGNNYIQEIFRKCFSILSQRMRVIKIKKNIFYFNMKFIHKEKNFLFNSQKPNRACKLVHHHISIFFLICRYTNFILFSISTCSHFLY